MSEKAANVQRRTLKGFQKTWIIVALDHFKIVNIFGSLEAKHLEVHGGSRLLHSTLYRFLLENGPQLCWVVT